jgi:hypothetical protein
MELFNDDGCYARHPIQCRFLASIASITSITSITGRVILVSVAPICRQCLH